MISDDIADIIRAVLQQPGLALQWDTTAADVSGWDSLANINILVAIEAKFGVRFHAGEIDELKNVGDFVRLVEEKRNAVSLV